MSARNERHREARIPRAVCICDVNAIFDGEDRCIKCGKLWPSAYGKQAKSKLGNYQLLLKAIDRERDRSQVGRNRRFQG